MTVPRSVLAATVLTAALGLAGCSAAGSTGTSAPANAAGPSGSAATTGPAQSTPPSATKTSQSTTTARGRCTSIDQATAEGILGFATKPGLSSSAGGTANLEKLDGCTYISDTAGALGYTVVRVSGQIAHSMIGAIKARMGAAGSAVSFFDAGMPDSVAFTQHLGAGVDSQITVLAGDLLISVASTRKDSNVVKAQAAAKAAAQKLLSGS